MNDKYISRYFRLSDLIKTTHNVDNSPTPEHLQNLKELSNYCLDSIFDAYHTDLIVTSAYRSLVLNNKIGGSKTSAHSLGFAADLQPKDKNMKRLQQTILKWAETHDFDQIIIEYPNANNLARWIHVGYKNKLGQQRKQLLYTIDGRKYLPLTQKYYLK